MILIDSSIWIDFFNGHWTTHTRRMFDLLDTGQIVVGDLVMLEVLQGCRSDENFARARDALARFPLIQLGGADRTLQAALNYRALRSRGITVRKTIDCLIATCCIIEGWSLLFDDRDFDPFVTHFGLHAALPA